MKKTDDKNRKLTKAEQKRLEKFETTKAQLFAEGYEMKEHTLGITYANVMAFVVTLPFFLPVILVYRFVWGFGFPFIMELNELLMFLGFCILFVVLHEVVHGLSFAAFTENGFKSVSFGVMPEMLTPYCNCSEPLKKNQYILSLLAPLIVVGIIPSVIGIVTGWYWLYLVGVLMIMGAGGDIIITFRMLKYKSEKNEVVYYDHPTKCGFITFER